MTEIRAYVLCKVQSGTEREVCNAITQYSNVSEASVVFGEYDVIVSIDAANLEQLEFIVDKIRMIPSVTFTSTMVVGKQYKKRGTLTL
ncbi:MAG: Lrp/AsnC ligand binding domain-containing protein [Candidatus Bathyarchaeia archaeon]